MPYMLHHDLFSGEMATHLDSTPQGDVLVVADSGTFVPGHPGVLRLSTRLAYSVRGPLPDPNGHDRNGPNGPNSPTRTVNVLLQLRTPDGALFTGTSITAADLARWRDRRGVSAPWAFNVSGRSMRHVRAAGNGDVASAISVTHNFVGIGLDETVLSQSAPPLVQALVSGRGTQRFAFDLWRVGQLRVGVRSETGVPDWLRPTRPWRGTLRLRDPAGTVVASSDTGRLSLDVPLSMLGRSRTATGQVNPWSLEVATQAAATTTTIVSAEVVATARLTSQVLQNRLDTLLGPSGQKISLRGENRDGRAQLRLRFLDEVSAEVIDMHGLLDSVIAANPQDAGIDAAHPDIRANVTYTVFDQSESIGYGLRAIVNQVSLRELRITLGASQHLAPTTPALRVQAILDGEVLVRIGGFTLATARFGDGHIDAELGFRVGADGAMTGEVWLPVSLLDVTVHWEAALAAGILSFGVLALGLAGLVELIEVEIHRRLRDALRTQFDNLLRQLPRLFAVYVGCDVSYRTARLDGNDLLFEHVAPLEPDLQPTPGYIGVVGRAVLDMGLGPLRVMPPRTPDTWAADRLANIDHIVVVMMENRSHDHVLGYLADPLGTGRGLPQAEGLSKALVDQLAAAQFNVRALRDSRLAVKTQFPLSVGHHLADVQQQLATRLTGPGGGQINSPAGFVDNFAPRCEGSGTCVPQDVLGYYLGEDLPFYRYLTEHYAWSQRYFCSHPGPTLPNRMYSLTGDVQFDRSGEAIVDNNHHDNFYLSRATTLFDLLTRRGVGWRVYESFPSVTMLRMFARYATDNTHIVPLARLKADVMAGDLPAGTMIEPAMHHFPQNDDHPVADMANGQAFLQQVYTTLRSNAGVWAKTLLLITYDEHGGFYDHVVPPLADLRQGPAVVPPINGQGTAPSAAAPALPAKPAVLTPYGVRVPTFVVSPWVNAGIGPNTTLDHCAILKTVLARFCPEGKPFLSDRVAASPSFNAFLSATSPRTDFSPPTAIVAAHGPLGATASGPRSPLATLSRAKMTRGATDYHDLTGMLGRMLGRPL